MTNNLVAELIRSGVAPKNVVREVAQTIRVTERTARNKINGETDFTVPEAVRINEAFFAGGQNLEYLFAQTPRTPDDEPAAPDDVAGEG